MVHVGILKPFILSPLQWLVKRYIFFLGELFYYLLGNDAYKGPSRHRIRVFRLSDNDCWL